MTNLYACPSRRDNSIYAMTDHDLSLAFSNNRGRDRQTMAYDTTSAIEYHFYPPQILNHCPLPSENGSRLESEQLDDVRTLSEILMNQPEVPIDGPNWRYVLKCKKGLADARAQLRKVKEMRQIARRKVEEDEMIAMMQAEVWKAERNVTKAEKTVQTFKRKREEAVEAAKDFGLEFDAELE